MSKKKSHSGKTGLVFEELEPRLLLSADPLAVATDASVAVVQEHVMGNNEDPAAMVQASVEQSDGAVRNELVIIDSRAPNFQQLHNDLINSQQQGRNVHVVILDAHRDGIEQINEALSSHNSLDAVHIVSHGDDGQLQLGATQLNKATLRERSSDIAEWRQGFGENGDLLIYGCDLASTADGRLLVNAIGYLTATDVAASDDLTGSKLLGGDWELEYEAGDIETSVAFSEDVQQNWQGTLEGAAPAEATQEEQAGAEEQQQEQQAQAELIEQQTTRSQEDQDTAPERTEEQEQQAAIEQEQRLEIVFIDESVTDFQAFVDDLQGKSDDATRFEIYTLDGRSDGVEYIEAVLAEHDSVDALHIYSHGDDAAVKLGSTWLNPNTLEAYYDSLMAWGSGLDADADIMIYGCNLAESSDGEQFVSELAILTGADVAASNDNTGHSSLSGDWELEYRHGTIETTVATSDDVQNIWTNVLAVFTVDTNADTADANLGDGLAQDASGNTSLRAAIEEANALGGAHTIMLVADTYTLSTGELLITSDITITGAGADQTFIDGNSLSRVLHTQGGATVTITDVTIRNGDASGGGNGGALWIDDATDNVTLERVRLTGNTADTGGAIYNQGGTLTMTDVEISGNSAVGGGQSGGGLDNEGTATLERVTVSGNTASIGGGIYSGGAGSSLTMTNSTISGNNGSGNGGGLFTNNSVVLTNVTITANSTGNATGGSGIHRSGGSGSVDLRNTIVAGNTGSPDLLGSFNSLGNNLIGDSGGVAGFTDGVNGDQVGSTASPIDPLLDPLTDNGGFAPTHALQTGSTAIDAGTATGAPTTDQRGTLRDDGSVDIGAYEYNSLGTPTVGNSSSAGTGTLTTDTSLTWSHTVDPGSYGILIVSVAMHDDTSTNNVSSVTYGGTPLTLVDTDASSKTRAEMWYLLAPTTGTADIVVTLSGATNFTAGATNFYGVDQSTPFGPVTTGNGSGDPSVAVASATGELVVDVIADRDVNPGGVTVGADQTALWVHDNGTDSKDATGASSYETGAASVTMDWTTAGAGAGEWAAVAISLKPTPNVAPVITSDGGSATAAVNVAENSTAVTTVTATDANGDTPTYSISGGADAALFSIDSNSGVLTFIAAPNFEAPADADTNNVYEVTVQASDGNGGTDTQTISVTVTEVLELVVTNTNATGTGSLHEAILNANANTGVTDTITFNIPGAGPHVISLAGALPAITDTVIIDGTTEPDFSYAGDGSPRPVVVIDGAGAGAVDGIVLAAGSDGSEIRGLVIQNFQNDGILVQSDNNTIAGTILGLQADGVTAAGNNLAATSLHGNIRIESANNTIGGLTEAERNIISASGFSGIVLYGAGATGNQIQGNYIGTDITGTLGRGNAQEGIEIQDASGNTIGGTLAGARNIISANGSDGMEIDNGDNNIVQGNYIGTDVTGTLDLGNVRDGIDVNQNVADGTTGLLIGGSDPNAGNLIAFNDMYGVEVRDAPTTGNTIIGNRIHSNGLIGIQLGNDGVVTANDAGDVDTGSNDLQNFPVITNAELAGTDLTLSGTLDTDGLNTQYRIEFYGNVSGTQDPTHGEGRVYLGSTTVTTDGSGDATFTNVTLGGVTLSVGDYVTATATRVVNAVQVGVDDQLAYGSTSEFAANVVITPLNSAPVINSDGGGATASLNVAENTTTVTTVTATDVDLDALAYSIVGGADADLFSIDAGTGVLSFKGAPDFETPTDAGANNVYEVTVQVDDGNGGTDTQAISVTVTNVDPAAVNDSYTIDEDSTLTVDWWDTDWTHRQQLTFDNSAQSETLTDFPVLIVLNAGNIDYAQTNDDGSDLRFFAADGTELAFEIEQWNEGGDSSVWVRVPQITAGSTTDSIWMYYGNASAESGANPTGVWDSNFVGVWHLNEEQAGTGGTDAYQDSTAYGNDGIDRVAATGQEGQVTDGQEFGANDWIEINHDASLDLTDSMTISFWIKPTSDSGTFNRVVEKGLWGYNNSYYFGGGNGTNDLTFYLNGQEVIDTADNVLTVGVWQHAALSYTSNGDGTGTARMYINGVEVATGNYTNGVVPGNTSRLAIGHDDPLYDFDGFIDEVQISNTDRSGDWIAAQYQATRNQFGAEFVQFQGEETAPADGGVLSNDLPDGTAGITVSNLDTTGTIGLVTLNPDGTFDYDPNGQFESLAVGSTTTDTFSYDITEANGTTTTATVTITITGVNDAPVAIGESYTAIEGIPYTAALGFDDLLLNDTDIDGDTLTVNTTPVTGPANGVLVLNSDGTFIYTPNDNFNGVDSFTYEVLDGNGGSAQATATITVLQREIRILLTTQSDVNSSKVPGIDSWDSGEILGIGDPNLSFEPVGSDGSLLAYFDLEAFSASNNMTINGLHWVSNTITVGSANSVTLQRGDVLFVSDNNEVMTSTNSLAINAGDVIVFRPDVADDYSSGTFIHLLDQPGATKTTGITLIEKDVLVGDVTLQAGTFLFTQESVVEESSIYHFSAADVGAGTTTGVVSTLISSVDIDINWNNFQGVMIVNEDLFLDGTVVPAGSIVTTLSGGDNAVGNNGIFIGTDDIFYLTVSTTTMGSGTTTADATLLFDSGNIGLNNNQKKIRSFTIIEEVSAVVNVDPVITPSLSTINYTEGDPPTVVDPGITLTDPDSANFDGGLLRVDLGTSGLSNDRLEIRNQGTAAGQIGVSGNIVTYGGTIIGTYAGGTNGSEPLTVIFNANADVTAIQALLRNITYVNTSNNPSENQRTINFSITDGDGGVSNTVTVRAVVNNVNFAPVLSGANNMNPIDEDMFNNGGTLVSILTSGWITDADPGSLEGIAVVGVDNTNGSWEFSINGGSTWTAFGSPSTSAARHLAADANTFVRFVPNPDWNGTVTNGITFHAWDQTSGSNGAVLNITAGGNIRDEFGSVSYSNSDGTASWTSNWIETTDSGSPNNGSVRIESGKLHLDSQGGGSGEAATRAFDVAGASSAVLTFDYDGYGAGGLDTLAVEISSDGGSTWTLLENIDMIGNDSGSKSYTLESYTALTADMQLRFRVAQGFGIAGQEVNIDNVDIAFTGTGIGGSTAVSIASASSSITVNPVDDAPVARDDRIGLVFDGVDDYVRIGDYAGLNVTTSVTMEAWIKPTGLGTGSQLIVNKEGEYELGITADTGEIKWAFDNLDPDWVWHNTGYFAQANEWTHIAVTYDNGVVNTYANGVLVDTYNGSGAIADNYPTMNDLTIGGRQNATNQRFDGQIDEVRVWNTARTQLDIQTNMNTLLTGAEAGLIGNWRFDEGSGTTVADQSLLGHHGTLADGVTVAEMPSWQGYVVDEDGLLNVSAANGVLSNDYDADGDPLTAVLVAGPSNASAFTLNPDGSFSYTPDANFNGIDSFTYMANDGSNDSNVATVIIRVNPINDLPVATDNTVTTNEDTAFNFAATDFTFTDVEGDSLVTARITNLSLGSGTLTYGGGIAVTDGMTLTAAQLDTLVYTPPAETSGTPLASFDFTVNDADLGVVLARMNINVNPVNDAPQATNLSAPENYTEDTPLDLTDIVVSDVDSANVTVTLTLSDTAAGSLNTGTSGLVTSTYNAVSGTWTASGAIADVNTLLAGLTFTPSTNYNSNFTIATSVDDGVAPAVTGTKVMTGTPVNDAPQATNLSAGETYTEDTPLNLTDIVVSDVDSANVTVTLTLSDPAAGSLNTGTSGSVTSTFVGGVWTASGAVTDVNTLLVGLTFTPATDYNSNFTIATSVDDGVAPAITGTKVMTGTPVNDAPQATNLSAPETYTEDTALNLTDIVVSDVDSANVTVTLTLSDPAAGSLNTGTSGSVTSTFVGGVWTASGAIADVNTLLAGLTFTPATNYNSNFTIATSVDDGVAPAVTGTKVMTGTPVNDAPQATNLSAPETYTEDTALNLTDIVVSDVDSANVTVTLTLSDPAAGSLNTGTSGTVTSTFVGGVWTASGATADVNTLLAGLTFTPATDYNSNFTIATSVDDGVAPALTGTKVMTGTPVNDAPQATNLSAPETYTEDTPLNLTDIIVSDVDSANVTVTLTLSDPAAGSLNTATSGSVTSTYNAVSGTWSASGAVTDVNALLAGLTFTPSLNYNNNFSIATSVDDGVAPAITGTKAMTGTAVNDAPQATNLSAAETYVEDTPLNLTDIVVSDVDSANVTVTLTLSDTAAGSLNTGTSGAVTSTYNAVSGTWSASGAIADVNTLLAGLTFTPATDYNSNFTIATSVDDGVAPALTGTKVMTGTPVNDAPQATNLSAGETYTEDTPLSLTDIVVSDVDSANVTMTLTLSDPAAGSLNTGTSGSVTSTFVGGVWTASGAIADVNTLLAGLTFTPATDYNSNFTIATSVDDGVAPAVTGTKVMTGTAVNDAPQASNLSAPETYTEDTALNLTDIVVSDVDSANVTVTLTLSDPAAGSLNTGTSGAVTSSYNAVSGTWTASGAIADVNTLLAGLTFTPSLNYNSNFTIATSVDDGVAPAVTGTKVMTGTAVNDAPQATNLSAPETYTEDTALNLTDIVVSDVDTANVTVTLTLSDPAAGSLNTGTSGSVTSTFVGGVWTASGAIADVNTLLAGLTFTPSLNYNSNFTIATSVDDGVAPAITGTKVITGTAVNDAPQATNLSAPETYTEDTPLDLTDIVVSDVDSANVTVILTLSDPAAGSLNTGTSGAVTSTYNAVSGTWSASGAVADVNALLAGLTFTPSLNYNSNFSIAISVDDGVAPAITGTKVMTGTPVNDAPQATNLSAPETYTEDTPLDLIDIVVSDIDSANVTVTLTLSDPAAGSLNTGTSGLVTSTFAGGVWTASGAIADVNTLLAGLTFTPATDYNSNFSIATSVDDGVAPAITGTKAMTGTPVNDLPVASANTVSTTENNAYSFSAGDFTFTDVESDGLVSATITGLNLNGGTLIHSGSIAVTNGMTLTAAELNTLVYTPALDANGTPLATFDFTVNDAGAGVVSAQMSINVTAVNTAPIATNLSAPEAYTEDTPLDLTDIVVSDVDSTNVTVTFTLSDPAAGSLNTGTSGAVTSTYNAVSGTWQASGAIADVNTLLAGLTFTPSLNYNSNFSIATSVDDGIAPAVTGTKVITGTPVNDAPQATNLNAPETYTEDTALNLTDIVVSDVDSTNVTVTLTLSDTAAGSLNTGTSGAVTSTYNAVSGTWSASGAVADVNALLAGLTFTPTSDYNSNFTIATSVDDGVAPAITGTKVITGTAVNDAPQATNLNAPETYTEDGALDLTDIVVSDVDSANVTVTLTLSDPAAGSLNTGTSGSVTSTYNAVSGTWSASGAVTDVNTLLAGLTFTPATDYNSNFSIATSVDDGVAPAITGTKAMTGTAVNDAPQATNLSAPETYTEDTAHNLTDIVVSDVDSASVTVTLTLSDPAAGSLNTGTSGAVTSTFAGGVWTASGAVADVNTLLAGLTFTPATDYNSNFTIATSISDGMAPALTGTKAMTAIPVNDAPQAANLSAPEIYSEDTPLNLTDIVVSDVDSANVTVILTLSDPAAGSLNTGTSGAVTSTYNAVSGTWSASGAVADVNALLAGLTFTPSLNYNSNFTIATSVSDGMAPALTGTKFMTAIPVNDAPQASNLSAPEIYTEDAAHNLTDIVVSDVDSANVTVTLTLSDPAAGVLNTATSGSVTSTFAGGVWSASGAVADVNTLLAGLTFTPSLNYNSNFTIATSVSDGVAPALTGNKSMTAIPVNDAPQATNLNAPETYVENIALNLTDIVVSDVDSADVTVTLTLSDPAAGTLNAGTSGLVTSTFAGGTWSASGAVADVNTLLAGLTFTPSLNYNSNFTIATSVSDGAAPALTGTKAMTGTAVNNAPVATNLSAPETYTEDTSLNLTDIVVSDVDSASVTVTMTLSDPAAGTLNTGTSGAVTSTYNAVSGVWTASGAIADVNTLLAGVTFTPSLNYNSNFTIATSVSDGVAPAITGTKAMTGTAVNDVPVATANSVTTTEDNAYNFTAADFSFSDVEGDGLVSARITNMSLAGGTLTYGAGIAVIDGNTLSAAQLDTLVYTPASNANGTPLAWFDFTVNDADLGIVNAQMSVNVTAQPDAAVIGGVDSGIVTEDFDPDANNLLEVSGALTIIDPDAGEAMFNAGVFGGTYGVITLDASGSWDYAANNSQAVIQNLAAGATLTDSITISSVDGTTHDIVITIMGTNDAPVAGNDVATVIEGGSVLIDLAATDSDIDNAIDLNSIVITGLPANGAVVVNGDGTVTYTHNGSETLSDSFSYTISDISAAVSNTATVAISVNPVNDPPVAGDDAAIVAEGNSVLIDLVANDIDVDNALNLNSISIIGAPVNGALIVNGDGTVTYTHDGSNTVSDSFTYTIEDVSGAISNTATVSIAITAVNDAPTTSGIADVTVNEDAANTIIDLNTVFDDTDNLDSELTYSIVGSTNTGLFALTGIDASSGQLTLDYAADMNGAAQISVRATDPSGQSVDTLFTVTVTPVNDAPVMLANTGMLANPTSPGAITRSELNVADIDNTTSEITYTITALPSNGTLILNGVAMTVNDTFTQADIDNSRLVYQSAGTATTDQFGFVVSDNSGASLGSDTFNILVQLAEDRDEEDSGIPPNDGNVDEQPEEEGGSETDAGGSSAVSGGFGGGYVPFGGSSAPQQPARVLTIDPGTAPASEQPPARKENYVQTRMEYQQVTSFAGMQLRTMDALWSAIDKMKQEMADSAEEKMTTTEFKVAAAKSSGVVLTAGVVAWILRSGALLSSLMSTIPLWKGYDPLPILAYKDDDKDKEDEIHEDKIPTSLDELKKLKKIRDKKSNETDVDSMFGGSAIRE